MAPQNSLALEAFTRGVGVLEATLRGERGKSLETGRPTS